MKPYISFIIPVYKTNPDTLRRSIESITSQVGDTNIEICLVFDGDYKYVDAINIINYSHNVKINKIHKMHEGVSVARNVGIDAAEGDWILFVDADDRLTNKSIEAICLALKEFNADILFGNYYVQIGSSGPAQHIARVPEQRELRDAESIQAFAHKVLDMKERFGVVWGLYLKDRFF